MSVAGIIGKFSFNAELSGQTGKVDLPSGQKDRDLSGFAAMFYGGYKFGIIQIYSTFLFGTGDDRANDDKLESYFPLAQDMYGYFGQDGIWVDDALPIAGVDDEEIFSNLGRDSVAGIGMVAGNFGLQVQVHRKVKLQFDLSMFSAVTTDGLTAPSGTADLGTMLGFEGAANVQYRIHPNLTFGYNLAVFVPGSFFKDYYGDDTDRSAVNSYMEIKWRF